MYFICTFEEIKLSLGKNHRWADNLYNNNIYKYIKYTTTTTTTTTATIISEGGRPASTRVASPYGGPVFTGKPRIRSAHSRLGFPQSPLPALRRQASTCAWRSRLRKGPLRWSSGASGEARETLRSLWCAGQACPESGKS